MTNEEQARRLAEPFPPALLRVLEKGGTRLTYVPGTEVIVRLNEVLGLGQWNYQVCEHFMVEDHVVVRGRLSVTLANGGFAQYEQFGGQPLKRRSGEPRTPLDVADDLKGAATDALKKCAQSLGVALDLARKDDALAWEAKQDEVVACPECGEEATRKAMRDHVVAQHGYLRKADGTVTRPKAPQEPQERPQAPEAVETPPESPEAPTAPETTGEIPEDLSAWLGDFISTRLRGAQATKSYLSYRREQKLPTDVTTLERDRQVALWQFLIGLEPLLEDA